MFKHLFDLSYKRNLEEALIFCFFYIILGYYITGFLTYFVDNYPYIYNYGALMLLVPFIFYTVISVIIILRKNLNDLGSIYLLLSTIILTFFIPLFIGVWLGCGGLGFDGNFKMALKGGFLIWFYLGLTFGCIPVAILTTKEDNSLINMVQKLEEEKMEHEINIEKQLLTERVTASKMQEIEKHIINSTEEKKCNEKE